MDRQASVKAIALKNKVYEEYGYAPAYQNDVCKVIHWRQGNNGTGHANQHTAQAAAWAYA